MRLAYICTSVLISVATPSDAKTSEQSEGSKQENKSQVRMKIVELSNRICSKKPAGFLKILIKNEGNADVQMRFCDTLSFGGPAALEHRGLTAIPTYFHILPDGYQSYGGAFAVVNYEWRNHDQSIALAGTYDLSQPPVTLRPSESVNLCVPISLPPRPGRYKLNATFDSRSLDAIVDSRSSSTSTSRLGIFEANACAEITLP